MSRYKLLLVALGLIVAFGLAVIYVQNNSQNNEQAGVVNENNGEWVTLNNEAVGIEVRHPRDVEVINRESGVGLIKIGPTQEQGTEFYDGMSLNFVAVGTQGKSLKEFVDSRQIGFKAEPAVEETSEVLPVRIGNYDGYQFTIRGIGEYTFSYLPKDENSVIEIVNATVDPTGQGYKETSMDILNTLEIK